MMNLPRITWCATGTLALLPLHAAGLYSDSDKHFRERIYHYAISSYTPTLTALLRATENESDQFQGLLAISQPATPGQIPLPFTVTEVEKLKQLTQGHQFSWMNDDQATVANVLENIEKYSWIHLACHGMQLQNEATKSAFALYDGHLTLERISRLSLRSARLAFLSACHTATGVNDLPNEAVHLGAGMLIAGYQSVIATMWSISDRLAPQVAEDIYRELLKDKETQDGKVAYALHQAVAQLRRTMGENEFMSWVPFIHLGL
jgi:CHAT domain-containing protein